MKVAKTKLHDNEVIGLCAIARGRVPHMIVLYNSNTGEPAAYINLN